MCSNPRLAVSLLLLISLCSLGRAGTRDYTLIQELPDRLQKRMAEEAALGDTDDEKALADNHNKNRKLVVQMLHELADKYYDANSGVTTRTIDKYINDSIAVRKFEAKAVKDRELLKSIDADTDHLLWLVEQMVVAITHDDPSFDWQSWKRRWQAAKNVGWTASAESGKASACGATNHPSGWVSSG